MADEDGDNVTHVWCQWLLSALGITAGLTVAGVYAVALMAAGDELVAIYPDA